MLLLSLAVLTIALFAFLGTFTGRKMLLEATSKHVATVRSAKVTQVVTLLRSKEDEAVTLAKAPTLVRSFLAFESLPASGASYEAAKAANGQTLKEMIGNLDFKSLTLVNQEGNILFSTNETIQVGSKGTDHIGKLDISKTFAGVLQSDKVSAMFTDMMRDPLNPEEISWYVGVKIMGSHSGLLILAMSPELLRPSVGSKTSFRDESLGETGETYIVGPDFLLRTESRFGDGPSVLVKKIQSEATVLALHNKEGIVIGEGAAGKEMLSAYGSINLHGIHWAVISELQLDEALLPVAEYQDRILLYAVAVILCVALVSMLVSARFVSPIVRLTRAAQELRLGTLDRRVKVTTRDEVGVLTSNFNQMVDELAQAEESSLSLRRNIVHDLKTPVTVIKGCAETLQLSDLKKDPEVVAELLENIVLQSDRLLEDLREIITPVSDDWTPNVEPFDVSALISAVVNAEKHTSRAAHHSFELEGVGQPIMILADRRKIRRVLENLLSNAVKYSPGIGKVVALKLEDQGQDIRVEIRDQGFGLTPEELESVLTSTGRLSNTSGIEGSGFGVDSCRRVLQAHHGNLFATSEKGKGSVFSVVLPKEFHPE